MPGFSSMLTLTSTTWPPVASIDLLEDRAEGRARAAPRRPQVDHDRNLGGLVDDVGLEGCVGDINRHVVTLPSLVRRWPQPPRRGRSGEHRSIPSDRMGKAGSMSIGRGAAVGGRGRAMTDHRFVMDPPEFDHPDLVVMLAGWIDASGAAAAAMSALESDLDARPFVSFDDDLYIDYRARRPTLEIRNGVSTRPRVVVARAAVRAGQRRPRRAPADRAGARRGVAPIRGHDRDARRAVRCPLDDVARRLPVRHAAHPPGHGVGDVTVTRRRDVARIPRQFGRRPRRRWRRRSSRPCTTGASARRASGRRCRTTSRR